MTALRVSLRHLVCLSAALLLALASVGFATARHHAAGAETFVICTGYGLVTVSVDAQGNPVQQTIPCPDCLVLPVAVVVNPAMAAPRVGVADKLAWPIGARQTLPQTSPGWHQARAPPRPRV